MSKIQAKYYTELKSWPYNEASQIIKRQGGYLNFKIPEKKFSRKKGKLFYKLGMDLVVYLTLVLLEK